MASTKALSSPFLRQLGARVSARSRFAMGDWREGNRVLAAQSHPMAADSEVERWYSFLMEPRWAYGQPPEVVALRLTSNNPVKTQ